MHAPLNVCLAQCDAILGDVGRNLDAHLALIEQARGQGAGLVVFPELSLTGYHLRDLTQEVALRPGAPPLQRLADASRGLDVVAGWIEESEEHALYNAGGWFRDGRLLHVHRKVYPVNYGMFDERRDWAAGDQVAAFDAGFGRAGLLVCEDAWHPSTAFLLYADRADVVVVTSCSPARGVQPAGDEDLPGSPRSARAWDLLLRAQSAAFNLYTVYVNRCGVEDGTTFAGNSRVFGPDGEPLATLGLQPELRLVTLDPAPLRRRRAALPILRDERLDVTLGNLERIARGRYVL
ncbi:MAG: carbon-nitrogen hydrolase [Planctomycetes bacterium]|nr:carbon-nitrogen hydrolase [Planctomycetota bacterium]